MSHEQHGEAKTIEVKNMFLIGAGFTKAVFPNAPLNANLLHLVIQDNPQTLLRTYKVRYHTDDIEILLTRMDLETEELQSERLRRDRETINHDLAKYFERFRFRDQILENNKWLQDFAKKVLQPNDAIITTNYDCFLEGILDYYEVWSPNNGYPKLNCWPASCPGNPLGILIYKVHGSEHFVESPIASETGITKKTAIGFPVNESIYPRSGKHSYLDFGVPNLTGTYIIAPSFIKEPHHYIERIMGDAVQIAPKANKLIIIGSGLRPEDSFLWLLLSAFLEPCVPNRAKKKLTIVDPKGEDIKSKIVKHYIWDLDSLLVIKPLSEGLECAVEDLIKLCENCTS
jgi:hypothetical protein